MVMKASVFLVGALLTASLVDAWEEGRRLGQGGATALSCTDAEQLKINSLNGGYEAGGFPRITDDCTKNAVHILHGISYAPFIQCLSAKVNISAGCSHCWWVSGQYGFDHCKLACLGSWCSTSCLNCAQPAFSGIMACAGTQGPAPTQCDGVPGNMTGAEDPISFLAHTFFRIPKRLYNEGMATVGISTSNMAPVGFGVIACIALGITGLTLARTRDSHPYDNLEEELHRSESSDGLEEAFRISEHQDAFE